jgi:hypothetical protein
MTELDKIAKRNLLYEVEEELAKMKAAEDEYNSWDERAIRLHHLKEFIRDC